MFIFKISKIIRVIIRNNEEVQYDVRKYINQNILLLLLLLLLWRFNVTVSLRDAPDAEQRKIMSHICSYGCRQ